MGKVFRGIKFKRTWVAGELKEFRFTDNSFAYLGLDVETTFDKMTIKNRTNADIFYSIERDPTDAITVDATAEEGVWPIERKGFEVEDTQEIIRLRIKAISQGDIYIAMYFTQR